MRRSPLAPLEKHVRARVVEVIARFRDPAVLRADVERARLVAERSAVVVMPHPALSRTVITERELLAGFAGGGS